MATDFTRSVIALDVQSVHVDIAAIHRPGHLEPIVFLHGFGSTKEDYADIVRHAGFDGHPFLAYDAPGCGESGCADLSQVSIPFLVETALGVLGSMKIERFHLVGHSTPSASSTTSSSARATRRPTPVPCTRPACVTRSEPRRCAAFSSRWSSSPTTAT